MKKFFKTTLIGFYILVLFSLLVFQLYSQIMGNGVSVSSAIYWLILFGWISSVLSLKLESSSSLFIALILFVISAVLAALGLKNAGEPVMRISFIGWLVGIGQALVEYKMEHDKKSS